MALEGKGITLQTEEIMLCLDGWLILWYPGVVSLGWMGDTRIPWCIWLGWMGDTLLCSSMDGSSFNVDSLPIMVERKLKWMGWWKKKTEKAAAMNGIVNLKGLRFACESRN